MGFGRMMRENAKSRDAFQDSNFKEGGGRIQNSRCIKYQGSKIDETRDSLQAQGAKSERDVFQRGNIHPAGCKLGTRHVPEWNT
jgi:hypothetical protein